MKPTTHPRVKICCIATVEEARMAIDFGASAVGLVSAMPSGPGVISEELIEEIAATIPPGVSSFLLTCHQNVSDIVEQQARLRANAVQLCDVLKKGDHRELRNSMPGVSIVQVIHVNGPESVEEALSAAPFVDALLLDSGSKTSAIKELGGTGRVHDWSLSRLIRQELKIPVFLAGGLNSSNVSAAIEQVKPFGVDVCTGVRTDGQLDQNKLADFFQGVRKART